VWLGEPRLLPVFILAIGEYHEQINSRITSRYSFT